jgi:mono/diheme cytochrome c family protein
MKHVVVLKVAALLLAGVASVSVASETPDAAMLEKGKVLFTQKAIPACAICHTMADAGATGAIGPDLDDLKPDAAMIKQAMKGGLGAMPSFSATLSDDDMNAIAAYVVHATGGAL